MNMKQRPPDKSFEGEAMLVCETSMSDHIAYFWRLLETEHVRILIDIRRDHDEGQPPHWDSASFPDDVAKALVASRAAAQSSSGVREDWPPPFELMKLQARRDGGQWTDIYPAQLEQMIRNGCYVRVLSPDTPRELTEGFVNPDDIEEL